MYSMYNASFGFADKAFSRSCRFIEGISSRVQSPFRKFRKNAFDTRAKQSARGFFPPPKAAYGPLKHAMLLFCIVNASHIQKWTTMCKAYSQVMLSDCLFHDVKIQHLGWRRVFLLPHWANVFLRWRIVWLLFYRVKPCPSPLRALSRQLIYFLARFLILIASPLC